MLEESIIIQYILDHDSQGFAPYLDTVRDMVNKLLAEHGASQVGIK
jgi:hypothetical protein